MPPTRRNFTPQSLPPTPTAAADHRQRLVDLRDRLTAELDRAPVAYVAGIARQLQSTLAELATMTDPSAGPSGLDRLIAQRAARLAQRDDAPLSPPQCPDTTHQRAAERSTGSTGTDMARDPDNASQRRHPAGGAT